MNSSIKGLKRLANAGMLVEDIAVFCGVSPLSVSQWLDGQHKPSGLSLLSVLMILRYHKISCEEQLTCQESIVKTGELMVLGLTNDEELFLAVNITAHNNLMATLTGRRGVSEERLQQFVTFAEERDQPRKDAIASKPILLPISGFDPSEVSKPSTTTSVMPDARKLEMMNQIGHAARLLEPAIEFFGSDKCSSGDRAELRLFLQRTFGLDIFTFRDSFGLLLSEEARTAVQESRA